jgi:hypothetical protein
MPRDAKGSLRLPWAISALGHILSSGYSETDAGSDRLFVVATAFSRERPFAPAHEVAVAVWGMRGGGTRVARTSGSSCGVRN